MQADSIPPKFPLPFAQTGLRNAIPAPSQIGTVNGAASLADGFPPLNFTPVAAGGVPPFGKDMNGILYAITVWTQWANAGAPITYDADFSAAIGGYPNGAWLTTLAGNSWWLSEVDNNTSNPDTGGANWRLISFGACAPLNIGAGLYNDGAGNLAAIGSLDYAYLLGLTF
jgi:hypothetical protein